MNAIAGRVALLVALARAALLVAFGVAAAWGTDALRVAVLAHGVRPGLGPAFDDPAARSIGWLGTFAVRLLAMLGTPVLAAATALALGLAFVLVERRARRAGSPFAFLATALAATTWLDLMHVGAHAGDVLFAALLFTAFDLEDGASVVARVAAPAIVTLVWCNVSAEGLLAPAFALIRILGTFGPDVDPAWRRLGYVTLLATFAATFATPALVAFWTTGIAALDLDQSIATRFLGEPLSAYLGFRIGIVLVVVAAIAVGGRAKPADTLSFAFALILGCTNGKLLPILGVAAAPVLAECARRTYAFLRGDSSAEPDLAAPARAGRDPALAGSRGAALALAVAAIAGAIVSGARAPALAKNVAVPREALSAAGSARGVLFCATMLDCDFAERYFPYRVLLDSRAANAPADLLADVEIIARGRPGWKARVASHGVTLALVRTDSSIDTVLSQSHWRSLGAFGDRTMFANPDGGR